MNMHTNEINTDISREDTAAEPQADRKAERILSCFSPGRSRTLSEKRRRAQRLSVAARRRNATLLRQHERDLAKQVRDRNRQRDEALSDFLHGRRQPHGVAITLKDADREERRLCLEDRWGKFVASGPVSGLYVSPPLYVNLDAVALVERALGHEPVWVRASWGSMEHSTFTFHPPRFWWEREDLFILGMRVVEDCGYDYGNPKPYQHQIQMYWLRPTDLLEHSQRTAFEVPAEAVPWASVLAAPSVIRLFDLPTPTLHIVAKKIKDYWLEGGPRQVP